MPIEINREISPSLDSFLNKALLNNSYDYESLHNTLDKTYNNAFSTLIRRQYASKQCPHMQFISSDKTHYRETYTDSTNTYAYTEDGPDKYNKYQLYPDKSYIYKEDVLKTELPEDLTLSNELWDWNVKQPGNIYLDETLQASFYVPYNLFTSVPMEAYRKSCYYNNWIEFRVMAARTDIFLKLPIIIIDNIGVVDYKIKFMADGFRIKLPYGRSFVYKEGKYIVKKDKITYPEHDKYNARQDRVIYQEHDIRVIIIDNDLNISMECNKSDIKIGSNTNASYLLKIPFKSDSDNFSIDKTIKDNANNLVNTIDKLESAIEYVNNRVENSDLVSYYEKYTSQFTYYDDKIILHDLNQQLLMANNMDVYTNEENGLYFGIITYLNTEGEQITSGLLESYIEDNCLCLRLSGDSCNIAKSSYNRDSHLKIDIFFFKELHRHTMYTGYQNCIPKTDNVDCPFVVIEKDKLLPYDSPIPIENFLIYKSAPPVTPYDNRDDSLQVSTNILTMHYPNIYEITDRALRDGDVYRFYYYYVDLGKVRYSLLTQFYFDFLLFGFENEDRTSLEACLNYIYQRYIISDDGENQYTIDGYTDYTSFKMWYNNVMSVEWFDYSYGLSDFVDSWLNTDKTPVEYKDEMLRSWIQKDPYTLRDYVLDQYKMGKTYHLYTCTMNPEELASRERSSTNIDVPGSDISFELPKYVFTFANTLSDENMNLQVRIFVDGLICNNITQVRSGNIQYVYIEKSMVTNDSYIMIDVFPCYSYEESVKFKSLDDEKTITITTPDQEIYPTLQDLQFLEVMRTDEEIKSVADIAPNLKLWDWINYSKDLFEITTVYDSYNFTREYPCESDDETKPVRYVRLNTFKVKPIDERVIGRDMKIVFRKNAAGRSYNVTTDIIEATDEEIENGEAPYYFGITDNMFQFNRAYLRLFRHGRLMPTGHWFFDRGWVQPRIQLFDDDFEKEEDIYVDVTPYRYKQILFMEKIPDNYMIDLTNVLGESSLNKPFDIRYYDMYLNGRRLGTENVINITPTKISLIQVKSTHNLIIYEKERDYEFYGLPYKTYTPEYINFDDLIKDDIFDSDKDIVRKVINHVIDVRRDKERNPIHPNTDEEEPLDYSDLSSARQFEIFYREELIPKTFVNPCIFQFSSDTIESLYPVIWDNYRITDGARQGVIMLDPDINVVDGVKSNIPTDINTSRPIHDFSVGHAYGIVEGVSNFNDTHYKISTKKK